MRTNIVLNEQLVKEAMRLSDSHTKKEVVDLALQNFVAYLKRRNMKNLFGKVKWEGYLKKMREI
ncbi:MAG: type II toxin-antitoxin system VapB family antitoxin [Chitinophagales bacterium]